MSFTVIRITSADGSVTLAPASGVGTVDLSVSATADSPFKPTGSKTANYNAALSDVVLCNAVAGGFNVTLPAPTANRIVTVKKTDASANAVTVLPNAAETIDGAASFVLNAQWESITLVSNGVNWFVI